MRKAEKRKSGKTEKRKSGRAEKRKSGRAEKRKSGKSMLNPFMTLHFPLFRFSAFPL